MRESVSPHPEERGTRVSKDAGPAGGLALRDGSLRSLLRVRSDRSVECQTAEHTTAQSRGVVCPSFANVEALEQVRAQGKPGAGCTRRSRATEHTGIPCTEAHGHELQVQSGTSRLSPRNGVTAYSVLSPVSGVDCHRCRPRTGGADRRHGRGARTTRLRRPLDSASSGEENPPDATSVHRSPRQRTVTIAMRPSEGRGMGEI